MTTDLAKLSAGATQGPWKLSDMHGIYVPLASPWREDAFCRNDATDESRANEQFIVALVNAYRTGQLVERDGVVVVVDALEEAREYIANAPQTRPTGIRAIDSRSRAFQELGPHILVAKIATALTAIKGGGDASV